MSWRKKLDRWLTRLFWLLALGVIALLLLQQLGFGS